VNLDFTRYDRLYLETAPRVSARSHSDAKCRQKKGLAGCRYIFETAHPLRSLLESLHITQGKDEAQDTSSDPNQ
jgi:hypothetical protein